MGREGRGRWASCIWCSMRISLAANNSSSLQPLAGSCLLRRLVFKHAVLSKGIGYRSESTKTGRQPRQSERARPLAVSPASYEGLCPQDRHSTFHLKRGTTLDIEVTIAHTPGPNTLSLSYLDYASTKRKHIHLHGKVSC